MKIYISGPITGTDDYMERFKVAEIYLRGQGHEVVNPAIENSELPAGTSWERYMGESLRMLCECDAIYMMWNWMMSRGARLERVVAMHMNKKIMLEGEL